MPQTLMKTIPVSFLAAGMLLPVVCLAQAPLNPPENRKEGKHGGDRSFYEAWKLADANHDESISKEEFDMMPRLQKLPEEKREMLFSRMDKDSDGKVSREELAKMGKSHDGKPDPPAQRLWELDADKSGGISLEEFKVGPLFKKLSPEKQQKVFARLDTDSDGVITPKDKPEPPPRRPEGKPRPENGERPEPINRKLDVNGDGSLSFDEFRAGPAMKNLSEDEQEDRFERLDRNGDQKLSPEDFPPPPPPPPE